MNILEIIIAIFLLLGAFWIVISGIGMMVLPNTTTRLHASSKTSTLGLGCFLIAAVLYHIDLGYFSVAELVMTLLLFITAPISSLFMAQAALYLETKKNNFTR